MGWYKILWVILLVIFSIYLQQQKIFISQDNTLYDIGLSLLKEQNDPQIVIAIDSHSLKKLGPLPWSYAIHAEFIEKLTEAKVKQIGYNVLFDKPGLNETVQGQRFVQAIQRNGKVVLPVSVERTNGSVRTVASWPELLHIAAAVGHINVDLVDGYVLSSCLQVGAKGIYWPSFSLALLSLQEVNTQPSWLSKAGQIKHCPSLRKDFTIKIPFDIGKFPIKKLPYYDVLTDAQLRQQLAGKTVIVGTTEDGVRQLAQASVQGQSMLLSSSELSAYALSYMQRRLSVEKMPIEWVLGLSALLVACTFLYMLRWPNRALPINLIFGLLTVSLSAGLLYGNHIWFPPSAILFTLVVAHILWNWRQLDLFSQLLFSERKFARAALQFISDAIITTGRDGCVKYMNPAAERLTGFPFKIAHGMPVDRLLSIVDSETKQKIHDLTNVANRYSKDISEFKTVITDFMAGEPSGECVIQLKGVPIKYRGSNIGCVYTLTDLTETLQINSKINYLATHDALTALPNRTLLQDNIAKAIVSSKRNQHFFALMFIDLDGFKKINDGLGHVAGDFILKEVAVRLAHEVRQLDTVARWGGDEFVLLIDQLTSEEPVLQIASKIVSCLAKPHYFRGNALYVTSSIGISLFPKDGITADTLLAHADAAMYLVKEQGRNGFKFYSTSLNESAKKRLVVEKEMYFALDQGHFEVYYQPQIEPKTGHIIGAEALIRWNHPQRGLIYPDEFIALAEENGLIHPIYELVLSHVCAQLKVWQDQGLLPITVSINLSPRQFQQQDLSVLMRQILEKYNIPGERLNVEITESLMIKQVGHVVEMLRAIKALGVSVAIDDFGTGYSSLSMLANFPVDQLKIDRSFIQQMSRDVHCHSIVQAIITLGHNLHIDIVAEGVETQEQLNCLKAWNCDYIQGYYYSKPVAAQEMGEMLQKEYVD